MAAQRRRGDCGGRLANERETQKTQTDSQVISAEVGKWSYKKDLLTGTISGVGYYNKLVLVRY
jgi:hypothetical protein